MNMHANLEADTSASENMTLPATLENVGNLVEARSEALRHWLTRYDTFHALSEPCANSLAGDIPISGDRDYADTGKISAAFLGAPDQTQTRTIIEDGTTVRREFTGREWFDRQITHEVDRRCWRNLLNRLGFDRFLDRQAREEFESGLKNAPIPFLSENVAATFGHIWESRSDIWLRGIANTFMALDRRFRSHDAFGIGNRLVIERAISEWGGWDRYNRRDTLTDVERVFRELEGKPPLGYNDGIAQDVSDSQRGCRTACEIEGEYFKVRAFKNGNLHLWFTRKDLLKEVNKLLLDYFKPIEGDVSDDGGAPYDSGPAYHSTPARYYGEFFTSAEVAREAVSDLCIIDGMTVLEPSAGGGMLATHAQAKGGNVHCIEIQPNHARELEFHGFPTICADFLTIDPARHGMQYDRIIMNPPFDRGRDCDHVRHALQFLKPGGRLVAIMSARAEFATDARHKALHKILESYDAQRWSRNVRWTDLPEKSFAHAGTNVNTVMLSVTKPK